MTKEQIKESLTEYEADAHGEYGRLYDFLAFRQQVLRDEGSTYQQNLHHIVQEYIACMPSDASMRKSNLVRLYNAEMEYFLYANSYSECFRYIHRILEEKEVNEYYYCNALSYGITILVKLKLKEDVVNFVHSMEQFLSRGNRSVHVRYLAYMNLMYAYAFLKDNKNYVLAKAALDACPEHLLEAGTVYRKRLFALASKTFLHGMEAVDENFIFELNELMTSPLFSTGLISDMASALIPVFENVQEVFLQDEIVSYVMRLIETADTVTDVVDYYSFLFGDLGLSKEDEPELYEKYIEALEEYYRHASLVHRREVRDEIIQYEADKRNRNWSLADEMTGLGNRRAYELEISHIEKTAEENGKKLPARLCFVMGDLNGLKHANDTFGHAAGDELICAAANMLEQAFLKHGKVYRVGGDEFAAVIYADTDELRRDLEDLESLCAAWKGEFTSHLSVAVGCASAFDMPLAGVSELVKCADSRMYESKRLHYESTGFDRRSGRR